MTLPIPYARQGTIDSPRSPVRTYLRGLAASSRRVQLVRLRAAVAALTDRQTRDVEPAEVLSIAWGELTPEQARLIRDATARTYDLAHANGILAAVRGVLDAADALTPPLAKRLRTVKGERVPRGRHLTAAEKRKLFRACAKDPGPAGIRDAALLGLGLTCGLRVSEVAGLNVADYDPSTGELTIRRGKGNKDRRLWVSNGAQDALADWLAVCGMSRNGPLFTRLRKGGTVMPGRLSPSGLQAIIEHRAAQAKVERFTMHDLRRTVVGDLLDEGEDIVTVAAIAGHASPTTTARYDRRPEERKREAQSRLTVPYKKRG